MKKTKQILANLFLNDEGKPFQATDGQANIFASIVNSKILRLVIRTITQYGKSNLTALAILFLCASTSKRILIVSPREEQSKIIMDYIRNHAFDNELFVKLIEIEGSVDRFRRERSKTRIDWKTGASVMILTADARTLSKEAKNLMGFGADIVIVDESSLIPDVMFSKILRMVGGVTNGKIVQLGNPFERNHFFNAFKQDRYEKIIIDWRQALKEGRITQEFLDEAKETIDDIDWQVFYECNFPDSVSDALIPLSKIEEAVNRNLPEGIVHFGGDIARFGSDSTIAVIRKGAKITLIEKMQKQDTMQTVGAFRRIIDEEKPQAIRIDVIGVGAGVVDKLNEDEYNVDGINVASSAVDSEKFSNVRAEMFWGLRERFLKDDISIPDDGELVKQLSEIRYSFNSRGQVVIEGKEKMKRRGLKSPDKADAIALAFYSVKKDEEAFITMI